MNQPTVGIAVLTYRSRRHLHHCLPPLIESPLKPKILLIDTSSKDGTLETAQAMGVETLAIPQAEFNHGATREKARRLLGTDIVVMITPDAYAVDSRVLEQLIQPIAEGKASLAYGRQLPHEGASFLEAFPREFNYPEKSHLRSIADLPKYGVYTFFCSDSCAAYSNKALDEIGGFKTLLLGEDTIAAAELLKRGHKIAYVAEARVKHSHKFTLTQEFKRYFDIGLTRTAYREILQCRYDDSQRGRQFLQAMLQRLLRERPMLLPYALLQTGIKWLGYQIGKHSLNAPLWFKRALSSQPYFF